MNDDDKPTAPQTKQVDEHDRKERGKTAGQAAHPDDEDDKAGHVHYTDWASI